MPIREGQLPVPGARLHYREIGEGPPLVALHGGPDFDHHYLVPELDRVANRLRLIYYDQRGRGRSAAGVAPADVGLESEMDDLDAVRRHFGLDTMALLGHSWGCVVALEYALRHPSRVSHLVLMNPAPASHADLRALRQHRQATEPDTLARMRAIAATERYAEGDIATEASYYRLHFGGTLSDPALTALVDRLRAHATPGSILVARAIEDRLYAQTWDAVSYDLPARLRTCVIPTRVIHGSRDLIPVECARHISEAIPGARLLVLEDRGHFAYLEDPEAVARAIVPFLLEERAHA